MGAVDGKCSASPEAPWPFRFSFNNDRERSTLSITSLMSGVDSGINALGSGSVGDRYYNGDDRRHQGQNANRSAQSQMLDERTSISYDELRLAGALPPTVGAAALSAEWALRSIKFTAASRLPTRDLKPSTATRAISRLDVSQRGLIC